jgi:hypothetical protein
MASSRLVVNMKRLAICMMILAACGKKKEPSESEAELPQRITEKLLHEEGLTLVEVDLNIDAQADIFNYYREREAASRVLVRKEVDLNYDGRIDVISYFDISGTLEREEMDGDFDGRFDTTDYYQDSIRVMSERDTDYDGRPNIFSYYVAAQVDGHTRGRISHQERDTDGDGNIDYWLRFDDQGDVIKTGRDTDGDGKMDVREE